MAFSFGNSGATPSGNAVSGNITEGPGLEVIETEVGGPPLLQPKPGWIGVLLFRDTHHDHRLLLSRQSPARPSFG